MEFRLVWLAAEKPTVLIPYPSGFCIDTAPSLLAFNVSDEKWYQSISSPLLRRKLISSPVWMVDLLFEIQKSLGLVSSLKIPVFSVVNSLT